MYRAFLDRARRFITAEDGPTAVEYAVMIMTIFLAVIGLIRSIGQTTSDSLQYSADQVLTAVQDAHGKN